MDAGAANDLAYQQAVRRVQSKLRFFNHLIIYVVVCCMLIAINLLRTPQHIWAIWPILAWGVGIALHALQIFYVGENSSLQQRMIEKETQKHIDQRAAK